MKILVVDIGGTFINYAFMKEDMTILAKGKVQTPQDSREQLIEAIGSIYDEMPDVSGIAISMPGIIDSENGYCAMGGALRYNDDFYLRHSLHQRCPVKFHMENDAKCAAMAEAKAGSLKDVADGFVLIFGTMIGGAIIKDQKLHKGKHFSAGEVSYITTIRDGMPVYELVDTTNQLKQSMPLEEALVQAGMLRLRPILMTTMTTVLSMVPMIISGNSGMAMMQGMAYVIIGGLCASTVLAMFLMPTFYLLISGEKIKK